MVSGPKPLHDSFVNTGLRKTLQVLSDAEKAQVQENLDLNPNASVARISAETVWSTDIVSGQTYIYTGTGETLNEFINSARSIRLVNLGSGTLTLYNLLQTQYIDIAPNDFVTFHSADTGGGAFSINEDARFNLGAGYSPAQLAIDSALAPDTGRFTALSAYSINLPTNAGSNVLAVGNVLSLTNTGQIRLTQGIQIEGDLIVYRPAQAVLGILGNNYSTGAAIQLNDITSLGSVTGGARIGAIAGTLSTLGSFNIQSFFDDPANYSQFKVATTGSTVNLSIDEAGSPTGTLTGFEFNAPVGLPTYTVAAANALSPITPQGYMIYVTDNLGGAQPAWSDGENFRTANLLIITT